VAVEDEEGDNSKSTVIVGDVVLVVGINTFEDSKTFEEEEEEEEEEEDDEDERPVPLQDKQRGR
jgi:hypothetical protein